MRASHTLNLSPSHSKITSSLFHLWEPTPLRLSLIYILINSALSGATPKSKSSLTSALLSLCTYYSTRLLSCQVLYFSEKILDENLVQKRMGGSHYLPVGLKLSPQPFGPFFIPISFVPLLYHNLGDLSRGFLLVRSCFL